MALLTDDNAGLVQIAAAVFIVICAMLYYILPQNSFSTLPSSHPLFHFLYLSISAKSFRFSLSYSLNILPSNSSALINGIYQSCPLK